MRQDSGIGVLDKAVGVLHTIAESPCGLAELCDRTGLPRATAHRLAAGLEVHRLLARDGEGRWRLGPAVSELAAQVNDPLLAASAAVLPAAKFTDRALTEVRRRGWAQSAAEREPGVASVSAPVRDAHGAVIAAISVSGPIDRMGRRPGERWAADLLAAADALARRL